MPYFTPYLRSLGLTATVIGSSYFAPEEGVKAMAQINGFNNMGKLLAFVLGTATAACFGYKAPLLISCIAGAAVTAYYIFKK